MRTKTQRLLAFVPCLSLPLVVVAYLVSWNRLPDTVAVHFDGGGNPDGWMSKVQLLVFEIGLLLFVLLRYTWRLLRDDEAQLSTWAMLSYYVGVAVVTTVCFVILLYNT